MLRELYLKNYLFVKEKRLSFHGGMCAITGETGAGKSVLIGAISLIMGDNNFSMEAHDSHQSIYLEATFDISTNPDLQAALAELGYEDEMELVIAREQSIKGKSSYFIYGRKSSLAVIKELKPLLIDFHHQRDQQKLLSPIYQQEILDRYGHLQSEVMSFKTLMQRTRQSIRDLHRLRLEEQQNRQLQELYLFQLEELVAADLKADEDVLLEQEHQLLSSAVQIAELAQSLYNDLYAGNGSSYDSINAALSALEKYSGLHGNLQEIQVQLSIALEAVQSGSLLLRDIDEVVSHDPQRLEYISYRLDFLNNLKHKHRAKSVSELVQIQDRLTQQTQTFSTIEEQLKILQVRIDQDYEAILLAADQLSLSRAKIAVELANELETNIRLLSIPSGRVEIRIDKIAADKKVKHEYLDALNERGQDLVEILFSANPGSPIKSLSAVASGGELSRILLAIKKVLTQSISPKLIILDEIDTGIGGKTAEQIAGFIHEIAGFHTVLCITHLAQIAAVADQHIALSKSSTEDKTLVEMVLLDRESRRMEIARMLSGNITDVSLQHADELLDNIAQVR